MDRFFNKFPLVVHSNTVVRNLLAKVSFEKNIAKDFFTFHPYTVQEGDRPETVAYLYYGDVSYDWVVYFSNDIVDPYYEWYMDQQTFNTFIESKYGSITKAQNEIVFYRSNYVDDFSIIEVATFDALATEQKKYWIPVYSVDRRIIKYTRKKEDKIFETNKVLSLNITITGNTAFTINERVTQTNNNIIVASGFAKHVSNTSLIIDKIVGTFANNISVKGVDSGANATFTTVTTLTTSIPSNEQIYFVPVTAYEYENELNEQRKNIKLLDKMYLQSVTKQFEELLLQ